MAVKEGSCTITVSANNGASDTCRVVVEDKIDFSELFAEYKSMTWCSIASDGSYMKVDTNPNDEDNFTDFVSYMAIYGINSKLGFSEALIEKMNQTRSMDGRLTDANDKVAVSWTYHPDQGLEILYENK